MLHLYFQNLPDLMLRDDVVISPDVYFNSVWESSWVNDPFSKEIIRAIDHVDIPDSCTVEAACLKQNMLVEDLSRTTKTLILCRYVDKMFNYYAIREEGHPFLMDIADMRDVYIACGGFNTIKDKALKGRIIHLVNTDVYVSSYHELLLRENEITNGRVWWS